MSYLQKEVLVKNEKLTSYRQAEKLGIGQKERGISSPFVLPTSQNPLWNPSWMIHAHYQKGPSVSVICQRQPGNQSIYHNTQGCKPRGQSSSPGFPYCNETIKQPVVLQAKWVYSGTAKNYNVRCINLLQTTGKSREQK